MLEILLADDDDDVRESIAEVLEDAGHRVSRARDGREAQRLIDSYVFDVAICDVHMPYVTGVALARRLRVQAPTTAIVVMTSQGTVEDALAVMRGGGAEFLTKPFDPAELVDRVLRPIDERRALSRMLEAAVSTRIEAAPPVRGHTRVAASPAMRAIVERLRVAAQDDTPVLLVGESGTGKKTLARLLHDEGPRRDGPFVVVSCASLEDVMRRGEWRALSSGGAAAPRDAWFDSAQGGTLVLDGVDLLPKGVQNNLSRVLAEPRTLPGGEAAPPAVRVVATAGEGTVERIRTGESARPLFFRLAGVVAHVPPLRQRPEDLLPLVAELLARADSAEEGTSRLLAPSAWELLRDYPFPGNVAELASALEWAALMAGRGPIEARHLPLRPISAAHRAH